MADRKIALITGATSGCGKAISKILAQAGLEVILVGRRKVALSELQKAILKGGGVSNIITLNLEEIESLEKKLFQKIKSYKHIDYVINCAGIAWFGETNELSSKEVLKSYKVNTIAPLLIIKTAIKKLKMSKNGKVINISSDQSLINTPYNTVYGSSKAALNFITKSLAMEYANTGIKFVAIAPGPMRTKMLRNVLKSLGIKELPLDTQLPETFATKIQDMLLNGKNVKSGDLYLFNGELKSA